MAKNLVNNFSRVREILDRIASTKSMNDKISCIAAHAYNDLFRQVVYYALNPYLTFKMSGNLIEGKGYGESEGFHISLFKDLNKFNTVSALSNEDKENFARTYEFGGVDAVNIINRILNKDLECGAGVRTFRKASVRFEDLPVHHPMKGESDWRGFYKRAASRDNICWSVKLDGTRVWGMVNLETFDCKYLSFNGLDIPNFHCFDASIVHHARKLAGSSIFKKHCINPVIFDGEVINIHGDFSRHMSEFRRLHDMDASGFRFKVFDLVMDGVRFADRLHYLRDYAGMDGYFTYESNLDEWAQYKGNGEDQPIQYLPHYSLTDHPEFLAKEAIRDYGLEGIMLKTWDHEYQHKRSWDWCKVKIMHTEDLEVVGKVEGRKKYKGMLGALVVNRQGVETEVGSGYTDEERKYFWRKPPKCIEVKYQAVLPSGSLRFPVFVRVRDDKA